MLVTVSACTAIGAYQWLMDPMTSEVTFVQSLFNHLFFAISTLTLGMWPVRNKCVHFVNLLPYVKMRVCQCQVNGTARSVARSSSSKHLVYLSVIHKCL